MNYKRVFSFLAAVLAVVSCAEPAQQHREASALLRTVPSDAIVVMDFDRCSDAFGFLPDSTSAIARVEPGDLGNAHCVLSFVYTGKLEPILSIDTGKAPADTTDAVKAVIDTASALGLNARFFADGWAEGERSALIISSAGAAMPSAMRHIEGFSSIYDAPAFKDAVEASGNGRGVIYVRNSGLDKSIPRSFLSDYVDHREMIHFLQKASDWTVFDVRSSRNIGITPVLGPSMEHYPNMLATLPFGESLLGEVLPSSACFAMSLPVTAGFREQYEAYLDACVKLTKYQKRSAELKAQTGKSPLAWEKEQDIREVAFVCFDGNSVALTRSGKHPSSSEGVVENQYAGFLQLLYGNFFSLDAPYCAHVGHWCVYGTRDAVDAFAAVSDFLPEDDWQYKNCHFVMYEPDRRLCWDQKGIRYGVHSTE